MIRVLVVDDEKPSIDELVYLLSKIKNIEIIDQAGDGIEALNIIRGKRPDIVFLDIQMPELSGMELVEELLVVDKKPHIIFTTAYEEFAIKAFEVGAFDYLLKPYDLKRLLKSLNRYVENIGLDSLYEERIGLSNNKKLSKKIRISVLNGDSYIPINPEDISVIIASLLYFNSILFFILRIAEFSAYIIAQKLCNFFFFHSNTIIFYCYHNSFFIGFG